MAAKKSSREQLQAAANLLQYQEKEERRVVFTIPGNLIFVVVSMVLVGHEPGLHGKFRLDHLRIMDDTLHKAEFQLLPFCRSSPLIA